MSFSRPSLFIVMAIAVIGASSVIAFGIALPSVRSDMISAVTKSPGKASIPSAATGSQELVPAASSSSISSIFSSIPFLSKKPEEKPETVSLTTIKNCLGKPLNASGPCLDGLFRNFLKTHSTQEALELVDHYEQTDTHLRLSCHPVVHAVGRETFLKTGTVHDSFAVCNQACHSGCYHGAMERFLRGDATNDDATNHVDEDELATKAATACATDQPSRLRFQCLHGLGHALMYSLDYRLTASLKACDRLSTDWDRSSCWGGAFMENVFASDPSKRDLSPMDYHYPCSKLDTKYRSDCYVMQTTRMSEMGLTIERLFAECRKASPYIYSCIQSAGRDLSNDVRVADPKMVAKKCEIGETAYEREACIRGVIYALIDNTWDGRYALPFCGLFSGTEDRAYCFKTSIQYMRGTYEKNETTLQTECAKYTPEAALTECKQNIDS